MKPSEQVRIDLVPEILDFHFSTGTAVLLLGPPGIGKSAVVRQFAEKKAKDLNRIFVDWHDISGTEKEEEITKNPEKYFLFVDIKLYEYDPTDLKGFMYIDEKSNKTIIIPWGWVKYFTNEKAAGVIFLDELNMAPPDTVKVAFQLVYQKVIANRRITRNVLIVAAGNPSEYNFLATDLPTPLIDRMGVYYVYTTFSAWAKWLSYCKVHPIVLKFLSLFPQYLYYDKSEQYACKTRICTPRSWTILSDLIYVIEQRLERIETPQSNDNNKIVSLLSRDSTETQNFSKDFKSTNLDKNIANLQAINPTYKNPLTYEYIKLIAVGYLHPEAYTKFIGFINALKNTKFSDISKKIIENPEQIGLIKNNIEQVILAVSFIASLYASNQIEEEKFRNIIKTIYSVYSEAAVLLIIEILNRLKSMYSHEEAKRRVQSLTEILKEDLPELYDTVIRIFAL